MKHIYLIILLSFSINLTSAQDEQLLGQWTLDFIFDYDVLLENPINPITIEFSSDTNSIIINSFCGETYESLYILSTEENSFDITETFWDYMDCSEDNQGFEGAIYTLLDLNFNSTEPKTIDYTVTNDDTTTTLVLNYSYLDGDTPTGTMGFFTKVSPPPSSALIDSDWYLQSITTEGVQHNNYVGEISLDFTENPINFEDYNAFNGDSPCNFYFGSYEIIDDNTINILDLGQSDSCGADAYGRYYEKYSPIITPEVQGIPTSFNYNITGSGINQVLTISNPNGDFAIYGKEVPEITIFKTWYSYSTETSSGIIYPSPNNSSTLAISALSVDSDPFGMDINGFGGCNDFTATHDIYVSNENEFSIFLFDQTLLVCDDDAYEPTYLSVVSNEANGPFSYELQNNGSVLILTNTIGEVLTFGEQAPPANMIGQWYLYNLVVDGNQINNPAGSAPDIFFSINPGGFSGFNLYGSGACNGFQSDYYFNPQQTFNTEFISPTLGFCNTAEEILFENFYFLEVLSTGDDGITELDYEITGTGQDATLVVTNLENGNKAFYGRQTLSIDDNAFNASEISLTRNPVSNSLKVLTTQNLIGSNYEILSITGQRIATGKLNSNSINVNQLRSGLYFLKISTDENTYETVKFIKD